MRIEHFSSHSQIIGSYHGLLVRICSHGPQKIKELRLNKVIHKGRKTQHQNPEFDHKQSEIFLKTSSKESALPFNFCDKLSSSCLHPLFSFFLKE
jgi:hypothetical protein